MDLNVTSRLREFLEAHSVSSSVQGNAIVAGTMKASAGIVRKKSSSEHHLLQLDVKVESPLIPGRTLIESFAGSGANENEAISQAWKKFSEASLHVLLEIFVGAGKGGEQVDWEEWNYDASSWRACLGPAFLQNYAEERPLLALADLLDRLRDAVLPNLNHQYHWLRFYYMKLGNDRIGLECLLDNARWPEGESLVAQWNWPNGSYSVRHFLILQPRNGTAAETNRQA